jgi:hypothetical protein
MTSYIVAGFKWTERAGTAAAVAASLTFLATQPGGPLQSIGLTLRDAKVTYDHFQTAVRNKIDRSIRQALVSQAWVNRPPNVRATLDHSAQFCDDRKKFDEMRKKAKETFDIEPSSKERFPLSAEIPNGETAVGDIPEEPALSWTPKDLQQAASESDALLAKNEEKTSDEKSEAIDEMAVKVLDELPPADKLFDHSALTALLKEHYPIFGEFLAAISSSVTEASFKAIRESAVRKVTNKRREQPGGSLAAIVSESVAVGMKQVSINLGPLDENWSRANDLKVAEYRAEVISASARLEAKASAKQWAQIEAARQAAAGPQEMMVRVGWETRSAALREGAETAGRLIAELSELGKQWPALSEPSNSQLAQLKQLEFRSSNAYLSWNSPLGAISSLQEYCDSQLVDAVSAASDSRIQTAGLRAVMGNGYDRYYEVLRVRREKALEFRMEIQREQQLRVEEYKREREMEQRRMEEYRPAEHPVEIP